MTRKSISCQLHLAKVHMSETTYMCDLNNQDVYITYSCRGGVVVGVDGSVSASKIMDHVFEK